MNGSEGLCAASKARGAVEEAIPRGWGRGPRKAFAVWFDAAKVARGSLPERDFFRPLSGRILFVPCPCGLARLLMEGGN